MVIAIKNLLTKFPIVYELWYVKDHQDQVMTLEELGELGQAKTIVYAMKKNH